MPPRFNLFNLLEIHRDKSSALQLQSPLSYLPPLQYSRESFLFETRKHFMHLNFPDTPYLFIPQLEPAATPDKSNIITYNAARMRKAESFSGSRNSPPPKRLLACRRVRKTQWATHRARTSRCATPVTRESRAGDSCRECSARAFYAKQLGILRKINDTEQTEMIDLPVGPDAELPEIAADMVPGYVYGMWVSMQRVDKAVGEEARTVLQYEQHLPRHHGPLGLHPRRFLGHSERQQPSGSSSVAGLKCGTRGGCLGRSTSSVFSIEEASKGGVLRESWFQSTLDIPVGAEENTFLLYIMVPSAGIHRGKGIPPEVWRKRYSGIRRYHRETILMKPVDLMVDEYTKMIPTVGLIKTGDSDGRQNPSRSYADVSLFARDVSHKSPSQGLQAFDVFQLACKTYPLPYLIHIPEHRAFNQLQTNSQLPSVDSVSSDATWLETLYCLDHPKVSLKDDETMLYSIAVKHILTGSLEETAWGQAASEHKHI
ncbi:hypothetical protein DFH09DRAFT_1075348 [Mycena vulgaris]|nr:hypothetical protein DFH09DRAFT_1075348 [Mycena vulgaris]